MSQYAKATLRTELRLARQALSSEYRQMAARTLSKRVTHMNVFKHANHIAAYAGIPEEISPSEIIQAAFNLGKKLYLPILSLDGSPQLSFATFRPGMNLIPNRFGILEPQNPNISIKPSELDLVLVPLLGFDAQGNRLGMGKGYYDHTFQGIRSGHPFLLGLAFECQKRDAIPVDEKDVKLAAVATEQNLYLI